MNFWTRFSLIFARLKMTKIPLNIKNKHILFASLDWGMGHLTRSSVVMNELLDLGNSIWFAGNSAQCAFIKAEFKGIACHELKGYEITLDSNKNTFFQMLLQFPKIKKAIQSEHTWLKSFINQHNVDVIISDNRYGFYHDSVESVLLTHQINLQIPYFKKSVNNKLHQWISKFDSVWVPDNNDRKLTGELSNPKKLSNVHFIGPLCRFKPLDLPKVYDVLIILSGPEPERTNFLEHAINYIQLNNLKAFIIGAKVDKITSVLNPTTKELNELIESSKTIISRAGYTTIMEMTALKKDAILIPTKGQYEQEYLAKIVKHPMLEFKDVL